jgi:hypothetical protein
MIQHDHFRQLSDGHPGLLARARFRAHDPASDCLIPTRDRGADLAAAG